MEAINPVLYRYYRGNTCESAHRGAVCMVGDSGEIRFSLGDPQQVTFPRSALKFFQQIPLVESGAADAIGLTDTELAVTCGSHNGEEAHIDTVRSVLKKAGCTEAQLQCGPQYPSRHKDRLPFYQNGCEPKAIYNNCSGKHAGFLALCRYWGYELESYIAYEHPVQIAVKSAIAEMHAVPPKRLEPSPDGCSAPIYPLSLYQQAYGYQQLASQIETPSSRGKACRQLLSATRANPFMLAGSKRYCTQLIQYAGEPVIGKTGAEGVFGLVLPERKIGIAIKIEDGRMGPQYGVAQHLLNLLGVQGISPLDEWREGPLTNLNKWEVGRKGVATEPFESNFPEEQPLFNIKKS